MSNVFVKTRVRRCEEVVFKRDTSEESWDWLFLASAAISGLYYIANPSDHSTTTQHLFRNPLFVLTLSGSSNKIHWWIAKNIHLIMSYKSAAWNVITAFRERETDRLKRNLENWAPSPRRRLILVKNDSLGVVRLHPPKWLLSAGACRYCSAAQELLQGCCCTLRCHIASLAHWWLPPC